jgi:DNA-binding NarL/FixJ family response regulator
MAEVIRVAILEDHPAIVDAYKSYVQHEPDIRVVATGAVGEDLPALLADNAPVHLLILDIEVPTSHTNRNPYPILYYIPQLHERYPALNILVISMHEERALIKATIDAGASGFVLKDDRETLTKFPSVVRLVAGGGVYFSRAAHDTLRQPSATEVQLSPRQLEVLALCAAHPDKTTAELAGVLGIADATVRNILSTLYLRLGVRGRTAAVAKAKDLALLAEAKPYAFPAFPPKPDVTP